MGGIRVRAQEPGDIEGLAAVFNCPGVIHGTLQLPFRSLEERRQFLTAGTPETYRLVAEIDGTIVGSLGLHGTPSPRRRHVANIGMAVHDEYQGRGVGSALMASTIELADNWLGLHRLELSVYTDNAPAIHLYEKFGFQIEGTARDFALRAGVWVDALYMARVRPASAAAARKATS